MRPNIAALEQAEPRPRKSSIADPPAPSDRLSAAPSTFFLSRGVDSSHSPPEHRDSARLVPDPVTLLQDFIEETSRPSKSGPRLPDSQRSGSRRRSTIKPVSFDRTRRDSSVGGTTQSQGSVERPVTPSPLPSTAASLPDSPESLSSRSVPKSDEDLTSDDASSQAVASSEDERDADPPPQVHDSQPELIMPSIKMPSRRPFTDRGKRLGRFKILVAGQKGSGKTSLIKSIVQVCEDIVHVDPLSATNAPSSSLPVETYASTRAYPSWWSDLDESRILRRRKSMGDSVLERNLCFVDTPSSRKLEHIIHYAERQLSKALDAATTGQHDFAAMLSGRGGSQVDVILYLVSQDHLKDDLERIRHLSELTNVVTLVARSDLLSAEEQRILKDEVPNTLSALPRLPPFGRSDTDLAETATAPYTITSVNGPDLDTMDASLLMSPEYVQPLLPSELGLLIQSLFEDDTMSYLRYSSAKKLLSWHALHPKLSRMPSPSIAASVHNSTLASPQLTSLSNSGVLIPQGSELSLNTSNSYALARVADHSEREERLAQIRLSKWASELQLSLQRERERYERMARNERALWLLQRMGEEVRDGHIVASEADYAQAMVRHEDTEKSPTRAGHVYQLHDPLGLLQWRHSIRTRGWLALQLVGSVGVVGGLAFFWLAKTKGITSTFNDWAQEWSAWLGMAE
ncbi:uncharacterized protein HMPREF1541_02785 [Cyphellophora europaea CBS 101466]|uniref:Septin-type G domain-containing protein n=1 Tax=Cyphellophora europaea (strain CBS 101466) TaxID=1220924 RepID=W2S4J3_CYPE1|nr:uncharacterized protein HMPREF1541_02785 [Cyphellophora europaea CBS 101466]ETN43626.1 hypothetical protein HMPREF1541_02785 [Cyphellophora europaea CBS 101466]